MLENRLIKQHKPKYNIHLKESERYHYIQVTKEKFPRVLIARKKNKKDRFYGPYTTSMFDVIKLIRNLFKLRACTPGRYKRPCLYYEIGMCSGPCGGKITVEDYNKNVEEAVKFIRSGDDKLKDEFISLMFKASSNQEYEKALEYKKKIQLLEQLKQRQIVDSQAEKDQDIIGIAESGDKSCIFMLKLKKGIILQKLDFIFLNSDSLLDEFLKAYYTSHTIPGEILVDRNFDPAIADYLSEISNRKIIINKPGRGKKADLVKLARKNAYLKFNLEDPVLIELKELLRLEELPSIIDCFDISNYGESVIVGACVQYKNKLPNKSAWRLYNIRGDFGQDDFRSMHEAIKRRYTHQELPNLIIVDGGSIQLNFALRALKELGLECPIVGLAKKEETVIFPDGRELKLNRKLDSSKLLIRIRDSVHNFSIQHSRRSFLKHYKKSELDEISGIGTATKFELLRKFGSLENIKRATLEEICDVVGVSRGTKIYDHFHKNPLK